jgi:hypothetical protein
MDDAVGPPTESDTAVRVTLAPSSPPTPAAFLFSDANAPIRPAQKQHTDTTQDTRRPGDPERGTEGETETEPEPDVLHRVAQHLYRIYSSAIYTLAITACIFVGVAVWALPPSLSVASMAGRLIGALICWLLLCLACRFYRGDWCPAKCRGPRAEQVIGYVRFIGTIGFVCIYIYIIVWSPRNTCVEMSDVSAALVQVACPWDSLAATNTDSPSQTGGEGESPEQLGCLSAEFHMRLSRPCSPSTLFNPRVCISWTADTGNTSSSNSTTFSSANVDSVDAAYDKESRSAVRDEYEQCASASGSTTTLAQTYHDTTGRNDRFRLVWSVGHDPSSMGRAVANVSTGRQPVLHFDGDVLLCGIISHPICIIPVTLPPLTRRAGGGSGSGGGTSELVATGPDSGYAVQSTVDFFTGFAPYLVPMFFVALCSRFHVLCKSGPRRHACSRGCRCCLRPRPPVT